MTHQRLIAASLSLLVWAFAAPVGAQTVMLGYGAYPVMVEDAGPVAAKSHLIRHPASPSVRSGHANFDHPAVAARAERGLDVNTFIVGHPAAPISTAGSKIEPAAAVPVASLPIVVR